VVNLQRRAAGVLPVRVDVPRAGTSHQFVKPLVVDQKSVVSYPQILRRRRQYILDALRVSAPPRPRECEGWWVVNRNNAFTDSDARAAWNEGADAFEEFVESGADHYRQLVHGPALLAACKPLNGLDVLDVACGQGYFCRELARKGARVVGVDLAERLVAYARQHEERTPLGIEYHVMSAAAIADHVKPESFDLVTSCMALQDVADTAACLRNVSAVLRPPGRMVFSVQHPCTDTPVREWQMNQAGEKTALKVARYFESGSAVFNWSMRRLRYHWDTPYRRYTLTEWSHLLAEAGFVIRRLHEPHPTAEQMQQRPQLNDCGIMPYFLIFDTVKADQM
jgi:2-polyprenyl-3-methyl-5-hydroxy-6-metoxy-1,4-benzoquinol methylase